MSDFESNGSILRPDPDWRPMIRQESGDALRAILVGSPITVVHFWVAWNAYDKVVGQHLADLAREFESHVQFVACDIGRTENFAFCREADVVNVPAVAGFLRGRKSLMCTGMLPIESYRELCAALRRESARYEMSE